MDKFDLKKFLGEKSLLNENAPGYDTRKFGEALPTLESVKAAHEAKMKMPSGTISSLGEEGEGYKDYEDGVEKEKLAKAGDLKEEEGFVEVSQDEIKMHLDQFRNGNIDGDDLANALEEIIYGR